MIWKTTILLSVALCVLGDGPYAISEQRIKMHQKEHDGHHGDLTHIGSNKPEHHEEYAWSYPSYEFSYKVHDPHTHDMKGHEESRDGDDVKGEYWLIQPDGHKRTVTYHVDKHSGFKATVKYSDHHHEEDDHSDEKKDSGEESSDGNEGNSEEGGPGGEAMGGGDEGHGDDKGKNEEQGRDGEESRGHEGYRHAWAIARKEHDKEESRRKESRGDNLGYDDRRGSDRGHGRDSYNDMAIIGNMGSFGRRDSVRGRGRDENRGWEESHKPSQRRGPHDHDTYSYPRFYRHTQDQRPRQ